MRDGCNFTPFASVCVWESNVVQLCLLLTGWVECRGQVHYNAVCLIFIFSFLTDGALPPLSGHNFSSKTARMASFTFSSICNSINPQLSACISGLKSCLGLRSCLTDRRHLFSVKFFHPLSLFSPLYLLPLQFPVIFLPFWSKTDY